MEVLQISLQVIFCYKLATNLSDKAKSLYVILSAQSFNKLPEFKICRSEALA